MCFCPLTHHSNILWCAFVHWLTTQTYCDVLLSRCSPLKHTVMCFCTMTHHSNILWCAFVQMLTTQTYFDELLSRFSPLKHTVMSFCPDSHHSNILWWAFVQILTTQTYCDELLSRFSPLKHTVMCFYLLTHQRDEDEPQDPPVRWSGIFGHQTDESFHPLPACLCLLPLLASSISSTILLMCGHHYLVSALRCLVRQYSISLKSKRKCTCSVHSWIITCLHSSSKPYLLCQGCHKCKCQSIKTATIYLSITHCLFYCYLLDFVNI